MAKKSPENSPVTKILKEWQEGLIDENQAVALLNPLICDNCENFKEVCVCKKLKIN